MDTGPGIELEGERSEDNISTSTVTDLLETVQNSINPINKEPPAEITSETIVESDLESDNSINNFYNCHSDWSDE